MKYNEELCRRHFRHHQGADAVEVSLRFGILTQPQKMVRPFDFGMQAFCGDIEALSRVAEVQFDEELLTDVELERIAMELHEPDSHSCSEEKCQENCANELIKLRLPGLLLFKIVRL